MKNNAGKTIVFWGAGKIGRIVLEFCKMLGAVPDFFVDRNQGLWGKEIDGIVIKSPEVLENRQDVVVFITMKNYGPVFQDLLEMGIAPDGIVTYSGDFVGCAIKSLISREDFTFESAALQESIHDSYQVLIDLQNGLVLGGVERWCKQLASALADRGYSGKYLVPYLIKDNQWEDVFAFEPLYDDTVSEAKSRLQICVDAILRNRPCTVVCNFVGYTLYAACIAKRVSPDSVRIITVNHSDDPGYYAAYVLWQDYIDICFSISGRIRENLLSRGFCQDKIKDIVWNVACEEQLERSYSRKGEPIRLGYAGRLTKVAKRADLLIVIAILLREMKVDFKLAIAGEGEIAGNMKEQVKVLELSESVSFLNRVQEEEMPSFWQSLDVCVCPSEWEGHSLTLCEAMAQGAVPIATDVSGVRDDVADGVNGFVITVGDLFALTNKVKLLAEDRHLLEHMGREAYEMMKKRKKAHSENEEAFFRLLLGEQGMAKNRSNI